MLGKLKFFSPKDKYGFIVTEADNQDIFVHYDDLHKASITDDLLLRFKDSSLTLGLSFCIFEYENKQGVVKRKAVDIKLLNVDTV